MPIGTRFYFHPTLAADVSPAYSGMWQYTTEAGRYHLMPSNDGYVYCTGTIVTGTQQGPWTPVNACALDRQYISDPLPAQTIGGIISGQLMCREINSADNVTRLESTVYVVSSDGSTIRGIFLQSGNWSNLTTEISAAAAMRNQRIFGRTNLHGSTGSNVVLSEDDRIVIELGYRGNNSATPEAAAMWGRELGYNDLPVNATTVVPPGNPWIEFGSGVTLRKYDLIQGTAQIETIEAQKKRIAGKSLIINTNYQINGVAKIIKPIGKVDTAETLIANVGTNSQATSWPGLRHLIYDGDKWWVFYYKSTSATSLFYAYSEDLINWTESSVTLFGTPYQTGSEAQPMSVVYDAATGVVIIVYATDNSGTYRVAYIRGNISDTSITWGSNTTYVTEADYTGERIEKGINVSISSDSYVLIQRNSSAAGDYRIYRSNSVISTSFADSVGSWATAQSWVTADGTYYSKILPINGYVCCIYADGSSGTDFVVTANGSSVVVYSSQAGGGVPPSPFQSYIDTIVLGTDSYYLFWTGTAFLFGKWSSIATRTALTPPINPTVSNGAVTLFTDGTNIWAVTCRSTDDLICYSKYTVATDSWSPWFDFSTVAIIRDWPQACQSINDNRLVFIWTEYNGSTYEVKVASKYIGSSESSIAGQSSILQTNSQLIDGKSNIATGETPTNYNQLIDGQSNIFNTSQSGINGQSRIQITDSKLINGQSNISINDNERIDGKSRILTNNNQSINGKSDIQKTNTQLLSGNSRISVSNQSLLSGQSNILNSIKSIIEGKSRIQITNLSRIEGKADIKNNFDKLIDGKSRITISSSGQIDGKSRIAQNLNNFISGTSRIQVSNFSYLSGQSRITQTNSQNITGQSCILKNINQLIDGISYISSLPVFTYSQRISGKSDISKSNNNLIDGKSDILQTYPTNISGISKITNNYLFLISGKSNILKTTNNLIDGRSRILVNFSKLIDSKSRIQSSNNALITGQSNILRSFNYLIDGRSRIQSNNNQLISGNARIGQSFNNLIFGKSYITQSRSASINGNSNIFNTTLVRITGVAQIASGNNVSISGKANIFNSRQSNISGVSRIQKTFGRSIDGKSLITISSNVNIYGVSRINITQNLIISGNSNIQKTFSQLIGGKSLITVSNGFSLYGLSRINVTQGLILSGLSDIKSSINTRINGVAQISKGANYGISGKSSVIQSAEKIISGLANIKNSIVLLINGQSRINNIYSSQISGKSRITQTFPFNISGKSDIRGSSNNIINGQSRISKTFNNLINGQSFIIFNNNALINGISNLFKSSNKEINGISMILSKTYPVRPIMLTGKDFTFTKIINANIDGFVNPSRSKSDNLI